MTTDLFDIPAIPGLASRPELITPAEEGVLIAAIDAVDLAPFRFQQWTGKRLTHSFGWQYDFQSRELGRGAPMPDWRLPIRDRRLTSPSALDDGNQAIRRVSWHKPGPYKCRHLSDP